jgi:hypothetical protein
MTDDHRQRHGESKAMMKAQARKIGGETRFGARHPEVGCQSQAQATANGGTLDRGDDWERLLKQPDRDVVQMFTIGQSVRLAFAAAEVRAGTEVLTFTAQHGGTALSVIRQALECLGKVSDQIDIKEVVWRPPDLEHRNLARVDPYVTARHRVLV